MKKLTALLVSAASLAAFAGQVSELWKSTPFYHGAAVYSDRAEDRVNLWPLLYHRAPATSVLWPLVSVTDSQVSLNPLYSHDRSSDEYRVLVACWGPDYFLLPPFWYRDDGSAFAALPLVGRHQDRDRVCWWAGAGLAGMVSDASGVKKSWLLPVYYWDGDFYSLPWSRIRVAGDTVDLVCGGLLGHRALPGGHHGFWAFPLLYADNQGFITPIGGHEPGSDWMLPIYSRKGGEFMSIPYGNYVSNGSTNTWWLTPLVGTSRGRTRGGYVFPFADWKEDADFDALQADFAAARMPASAGRKAASRTRLLCGLGYDARTRLADSVEDGRHTLKKTEETTCWPLLYSHGSNESVVFDPKSRRETGRRVNESSSLCGPLYTYERHVDTEKNKERTRSRVLWWLWNREERDGKVALDVFPGLTYDARPDGYRKTSLFWRFFRYEDDPGKGTSLDLFFIPCWSSR